MQFVNRIFHGKFQSLFTVVVSIKNIDFTARLMETNWDLRFNKKVTAILMFSTKFNLVNRGQTRA